MWQVIRQLQEWTMLPPRLASALFGLEALGHGMIVGCGNAVIGIARHVRARFGFRISMLFAMEDMSSFGAAGDDTAMVHHQGQNVKLRVSHENFRLALYHHNCSGRS